ncbi:hypothetical protein G6F68_010701 [Rhizopus microsporus]|nr:hypothetical protein G6F68_010701 [Rhizopus microsporus]
MEASLHPVPDGLPLFLPPCQSLPVRPRLNDAQTHHDQYRDPDLLDLRQRSVHQIGPQRKPLQPQPRLDAGRGRCRPAAGKDPARHAAAQPDAAGQARGARGHRLGRGGGDRHSPGGLAAEFRSCTGAAAPGATAADRCVAGEADRRARGAATRPQAARHDDAQRDRQEDRRAARDGDLLPGRIDAVVVLGVALGA